MREVDVIVLLERVYREVRGIRRDLRPGDSLRDDLGLDSLAAVDLLRAVEEELGLDLAGDDRVLEVQTVSDVVALVLSHRTP